MTEARSHRDIYHPEIIEMLHFYKAFTRSQETGKYSQTEPGSADIMVHLNGGCAIEVKTGFNGTFRFADWRPNQREWGLRYDDETHNLYWLAIVFEGLDSVPFKGMRKSRHAFLLPQDAVYLAEKQIPQESLPYRAGKGMLLEVQEKNLDALHLWASFALDWDKGWRIPRNHSFYCSYINPTGEN